MLPSALICREQENIQRQRAANAPLANVRLIAEQAAAAWSRQLADAEKREARHERTMVIRALKADADRDASVRSHGLADADSLAMCRDPSP